MLNSTKKKAMNSQSTNQQPVILVTGATGARGGSVARALLKDKRYHVRILTRNTRSQKAQVFQRAGAELVSGDYNDRESLVNAMEGAYGVFAAPRLGDEAGSILRQGKNLVDAVRLSGIRHFVMQTSPDHNKLGEGNYPVPRYDVLALLEEYAKQSKLPATFLHIAFPYENFLDFFPLQKDNHGDYYFGFPQGDTPLAMASLEDLGKIVSSVFNEPETYTGRVVGVVGADDTCDNYAAILSKVLNRNIYYSYIPRNVYAAYDFSGAEELANMFEVQRLYVPERKKDLEESYRINPAMQSFEEWVTRNRTRFINQFNAQFEVVVI